MNTTGRIGKNFGWLFLGDVLAKSLLFFTTIWIARRLADEAFGKLSFAQAILEYFIIVVDLGLPIYGTREIAYEPKNTNKIVANIISIRLFLAVVLLLASMTTLFFLNIEFELKLIIAATLLWMIPWALNTEFAFKGLEKMQFVSLGQFLFQFLFLISALIIVHQATDVLKVPFLRTGAALMVSLTLLWVLWKKLGFSPFYIIRIINRTDWWRFIRDSLLLVASLVVIKIYYSFDTLMLGLYGQMAEVGWYNAAYKIILMFVTFAGLLQTAFAPYFVQQKKNRDKFIQGVQKFALFLMVSGTIITTVLFSFSDLMIPFLFGDKFLNSSWILRYLSLSLIFIFADTIYLAPLLFTGSQKYYLYSVGIGAILNIILNSILIPVYSYYGAVIATILSNAMVFLLGFYYFKKIYEFDWLTFKFLLYGMSGCLILICIFVCLSNISYWLSFSIFCLILITISWIWRKKILALIQEIT